MDIEGMKLLAEAYMKERRSHRWKERGNKYLHGQRTARIALELRKMILPEDDSKDDILKAASWLHDISNGEKRYSQHGKDGALLIRRLASDYCSRVELDELCRMVEFHDDRSERREQYSVWLKILQDADLLDHFGSYEIWMHLLNTFRFDRTPLDTVSYLRRERRQRVDADRVLLNFPESVEIFNEKDRFFCAFLDRFEKEMNGEIVNTKQERSVLHE